MMHAKTYTEQYQETQAVINHFHEACQLSTQHGWAYEAGWLQSAMARVLMRLPRSQRQTELEGLARQAHEMEAQQILRNLSRE
jgi:rhamnogalacturonyl hydrolase YesR